jgi:DNA-binding CsgD family transcriptional regulator
MLHIDIQSSPGLSGASLALLRAVLDQVDYGLAVVNVDTRHLVFANTQAWRTLAEDSAQPHGLRLNDGHLCTRERVHLEQLTRALARVRSSLRGLLNLTRGGSESTVAVMPVVGLSDPNTDTSRESAMPCHALLLFAKQQLCDATSITLFANERGLTRAESQVLAQVCFGLRPAEIATRQGVQLCTVRSQLSSIRQKTASSSVRALVEKISVLPPLARQPAHASADLSTTAASFG